MFSPMLLAQVGLISAGVLALAFYPPASGPMALIALDGRDAGRMAGPALDRGAILLGRGPLTNILLVNGTRERIARPMLRRGILVIAAPASWCGAAEALA